MFDKDKVEKIDKILRKKMSVMFDFDFNGLLLLCGESLRKIMMNEKIDDYNFILLTLEKDNVQEFFEKFKLRYESLSNNEYEFTYNNVKANMIIINDLTFGATLSTDFLFYDIQRKQFIPVGIKYAVQYKKIYDLSYMYSSDDYQKDDLKAKEEEAKKFIQFLRGDNKRIRVIRKNRLWRRFIQIFKRSDKRK